MQCARLVWYHVASAADGAAIFSEPRGGGEEWSRMWRNGNERAASGARVHTYNIIKPIQTPVEKCSRILQICVSPSECVWLTRALGARNVDVPLFTFIAVHSPGVINSSRRCGPPWIKSCSNRRIHLFLHQIQRYDTAMREKNLPVEIFSVRVPIAARTMAHSGKLAYWWQCLHRLIMQTSLVVQCAQTGAWTEKKAAVIERGWGACSVLARRHKHLPFYQRR